MPYRTFVPSCQKDTGFTLHLVERSIRGAALESVAHVLCVATRQRFCVSLCCSASDWADKREKTLLKIPIDRAQADALAWNPDSWSWLDTDESSM